MSEGRLVLVRHGETVGNSAIRLYGATDIELSALGEAQVERAAAFLSAEVFDQLVTSPLCRARHSAEIIAAALEATNRDRSRDQNRPRFRVIETLRERDFGDWEGWTVDEVADRDPEAYRRWRSEGLDFSFPGGESQRGLRARVQRALEGGVEGPLFANHSRSLAVLHKGIIKIILGALLGLDYAESSALPVALGSVHRLRYREGRWQLEAANLVEHLGEHYLES
ncbi:MAG TPA: histidine phosphatase family protein [Nannocystis exedens]|nr:histidine phosphatase family protein [Nannocystis exedens]